MAASLQNLRAIGSGVEPPSLLPGQICFNITDKVMYVGDGSDLKTSFDGTHVPGMSGLGWYSLPMNFEVLKWFMVANPLHYGDSPSDQQILTWDSTLNHPTWTTNPGGGGSGGQVYLTTNSAVDAAPGVTVSEKISAAIVVSVPERGDSTIVSGIAGDEYEGLYIYNGTQWVFAASYVSPDGGLGITSSSVLYVNATNGNDSTAQKGTARAFATITAALSAADNGDTIILSPGTFTEDVTLTKGVSMVGTFNDQAVASGTTILGNFIYNLGATATANPSIRRIRFASPNGDSSFKVLDNSFGSGGIATISDCMFSQQSSASLAQSCFETSGTWQRSMYVRRPTFDGNVKHAAGSPVGLNGYLVLDNILGTGSAKRYYLISSGTVEFRRPSTSISPVLQTAGVAQFTSLDNGITPTDVSTSPLFGDENICYKGTTVGTVSAVIFNGSNAIEGVVNIGANVVYGWNRLTVNSQNLILDPGAIPFTDNPAYVNGLNLSQSRPQIDILGVPTTTLPPSSVTGNLVVNGDGAFYTITSSLLFVNPPTLPSDPGIAGQVAQDGSYFYFHNGSTWKRISTDNSWT